MNVTIFGGTGTTGLLVIQKALSAGHSVTAYARTLSKISIQHNNLTVIEGELTDIEKIKSSVKNADAVISVLGPTGKSKGLVISKGIKNIISAMQMHGVKRLIATATPSYKVSKDKFQFGFTLGVFMVKSFINDTYQDIVATGEEIAKSPLDWTIVRLPMLSNNPSKGKLNIGYTGDGQVNLFSLSRTDLADFLIQQLADKTYLRQAPVISN
ncbi:NAD(P)-dependent oxidoreductase [Sphingobacterium bovistauri]|uniref:NAD(P)H-binding protein n=1 Tax=Sphingobacterium bovistauri TaxID=2781959 RepID=A0ABS7Z7G1_9SPHI|nr:NAD(P)H-binding protein [Sphingobacterium bovistauri]MCA5006128.1 NAD(P)H-binding protein [Sphingobacterium bovistauri]